MNKSIYLAVHADVLAAHDSEQQLQLMLNLTPKVMHWAENIWLLDLGVCASYWQARAESIHADPTSLWRSLLHQLIMPGTPNPQNIHIGASAPYHAVLSTQPWPAILLLNYLRERSLQGFIDSDSLFAQTLWRELSWNSWWISAAQSETHLEQLYVDFDRNQFRDASKRMQQAMARVSSRLPYDMRSADTTSIKRRFGGWLSQLWMWSFADSKKPSALFDDASAFPWHSQKKQDVPHLTRHLETNACEWSHIEAYLQEDFNHLCQLPTWNTTDRATCLRWVLTLDDMQQREINIPFRHPHNLHNQVPEQQTALIQANYSFVDSISKDPIPAPIVGWSLTVTACLLVSTELGAIFEQNAQELTKLLELENQLPVSLAAYDLTANWQPEDSFVLTCKQDQAHAELSRVTATQRPSYDALAARRPLYLLAAPVELTTDVSTKREEFLERTMQKWWTDTGAASISFSSSSLCRSYYRLQLTNGQNVWAFHDGRKRWFIHGIFA